MNLNVASLRPFLISGIVLTGWLLVIEWSNEEQAYRKSQELESHQLADTREQAEMSDSNSSISLKDDFNNGATPTPQSRQQEADNNISSGLTNLPLSAVPTLSEADAEDTDTLTVQKTTFVTDKLRVSIDLKGGDLTRVDLLDYPLHAEGKTDSDSGNEPQASEASVILLQKDGPFNYFARAAYQDGNGRLYAFNFQPSDVVLNDDEYSLTLQSQAIKGLSLRRTLLSHKDSHLIRIVDELHNTSDNTITLNPITAIYHNGNEPDSNIFLAPPSYTGPAFKDNEDRYNKYDFDDVEDASLVRDITGGWVALVQHYFISAWVPLSHEQRTLQLHHIEQADGTDRYVLGLVFRPIVIPAQSSIQHNERLYTGPKLQEELREISEGLDLTVDYGWLWWIGQPIYSVLGFINGWAGNWGLSIILFTILLKLAIYPLSAAGFRSMGRLRKLTPRMKELQERYKGDRKKIGEETMKLYREHGVNPLGGCLPLLIPMPIFLALYWVLLESVELRHADFIFWITDLSARDPYFILPLLMGASMWATQKLAPPPTGLDPTMQTMMKLMPIFFTVFLLAFPAGLVLYWLVNNLMSVLQQWFIQRQIDKEDVKGT